MNEEIERLNDDLENAMVDLQENLDFESMDRFLSALDSITLWAASLKMS